VKKMQWVHKMKGQQGAWLLAVAVITALSFLLVFAPNVRADQAPQLADGLQQSQVYNGDLEVERGQVIQGDVNVYSGDVVVRDEGRIEGNLNVYSGDVEVEEGGSVDGNITAWSGDLQVDGSVEGSIAAMAGNVEVGGDAYVGGDISVMAGNIKQRAGAEVGGNILRGPNLRLPAPPAVSLLPWANAPQAPEAQPVGGRDGFLARPLGFVGRALTALLLVGLFVAGAAAVTALRPGWTSAVQGVLGRQAALSFATGLIANVLMLAVIGFLYITICLRPPALLLGVGMLAFNVAGLAAVGGEIGGRLSERMSGQWTPTSRTALGVVVPGAIIAFLWAIGGCFGFFANVGALLLGSFGVGAILVKALNLGTQTPAAIPPVTESPVTGSPVTGSPVAESPVTESPVTESPVTESPVTEQPVTATPATEAPPTEAPATEAEQWWTPAQAAAESAPVAERSTMPVPAGQADPAVGAGEEAGRADFTRIEGIGPKLSQRLHAANIHTFADLGALPPETIAGILGWTSERLLRSRVLEQARELAALS
jgi:predicted flap endonuclease-1-like 5' DNA nuclease/cytoskeletal protein CcmA (bactofilin family)